VSIGYEICPATSQRHGAGTEPEGSVLTITVDAATYELTDVRLGDMAPDLSGARAHQAPGVARHGAGCCRVRRRAVRALRSAHRARTRLAPRWPGHARRWTRGRARRSAIGALLRPEQPLELAALERSFLIRASDATIVTMGHALDVLVRREAPGVALHFVGSLLAEGLEVDLDIGVQYGLAPDLRISVLYQEEMVPVVRRDHPLANRRVAVTRLAALDQIAVASQRAKLDELTRPRRGKRNPPPSRIVPSFLAAAALVRASDAYTLLPNRLAVVILDAFGLCRLPVSGAPAKVAIGQAWSPRFDNDAGHTWLRGCVRRACAATEGARPAAQSETRAART
jgi:DNA-binding transcriptional LysR family regulator